MSSPSPHTTDLLDVDAMTADSQRDLTFIHDTFGTIFEDMGLDTLAAEVFNPTSVPSASITLEHPKTPHKEREMSSPRANGTDARFLHPDIDEFMAPSPAKVITSTPAKRPTTLKPTTPADHLLSLISSPAPVMHDYSSPTSRSTHTARSNFLSSTGNKLIHAASPSQQILADVKRKHARSPSSDLHSRTKRRRTDGTIPFAVIKPPSNTVEHYRPPPTTVGMVLTGTPASTTSVARTTLFQSTGLQNKTPATTTSIKSEVVESDDDDDDDDAPRKKKNSARGLQQKGLRHFSLKVCEKVERQQVTTYNKVADELVTELTDPTKSTGLGTGKKSYDEKNIRRRVYDALNVLMAMGIIEKEKKKITWIGLPGGGMGTEDVMALQQEKAARLDRLSKKRQLLAQLLTQQVCVRRILQRNATHPPSIRTHDSSMKFPFVVIECPIDVTVNTAMTPARDAMEMTFSDTFRVHEHSDILEKMNLPYVTAQDLPHLIPREMCPFYPPEWMTTEKKSTAIGKATVVKQEIR